MFEGMEGIACTNDEKGQNKGKWGSSLSFLSFDDLETKLNFSLK